MKAVLMSIHPEYCEKIFNGEKTLEIRRTVPKLAPPFKVYVYCTKDPKKLLWAAPRYFYCDDRAHNGFDKSLNGKVIGEFICKSVVRWPVYGAPGWHEKAPWYDVGIENLKNACLSMRQLLAYGKGSDLYALTVSSLRLYSTPKELNRFIRPCPKNLMCEECDHFFELADKCGNPYLRLKRPPQSWCYVENWHFDN